MFKKGNQLWKARSSHGAERIMKDPQALYEACLEYFEWCEDNPLQSEVVGWFRGEAEKETVDHPRLFTQVGLTIFLGITQKTWWAWKKEFDDLKGVCQWCEAVIFEQNINGAAVGHYNANIIARHLGLADKRHVEVETPKMIIAPPAGEQPPIPPTHGEAEVIEHES